MAYRDGHRTRLAEEIRSCIEEYTREYPDDKKDFDIKEYIVKQAEIVLNKMYEEYTDKDAPENNAPDSTDADYYRESINEYGTVYTDFDLDAADDKKEK